MVILIRKQQTTTPYAPRNNAAPPVVGAVSTSVPPGSIYIGEDVLVVELPGLPHGLRWHVSANTSAPTPEDAWEPGKELLLEDQGQFLVGDRSVVILVAK